MRQKLRSYSFWTALCGAGILLLQAFGITVDAPYVKEIAAAVLSVCVVLGIVTRPPGSEKASPENTQAEETETNVSVSESERSNERTPPA